jgi:hypothetical protein
LLGKLLNVSLTGSIIDNRIIISTFGLCRFEALD